MIFNFICFFVNFGYSLFGSISVKLMMLFTEWNRFHRKRKMVHLKKRPYRVLLISVLYRKLCFVVNRSFLRAFSHSFTCVCVFVFVTSDQFMLCELISTKLNGIYLLLFFIDAAESTNHYWSAVVLSFFVLNLSKMTQQQ